MGRVHRCVCHSSPVAPPCGLPRRRGMEPYSYFLHSPAPSMAERRWNPAVVWAPSCPRCESSNTKFCYYNNYSLAQPRYFCKACRRYWTEGGALRNVPIGGTTRRKSRPKPPAGRPHSSPPVRNEPPAAVSLPPVECPSGGSDAPKLAFTEVEFEVGRLLGRTNVGSYYQQMSTQMGQEQPPAGEEFPWPSPDVTAEETLLLDNLSPFSVDSLGAMPPAEELAYEEVFWSGSPTVEGSCPWQRPQSLKTGATEEDQPLPLPQLSPFTMPSYEAFR